MRRINANRSKKNRKRVHLAVKSRRRSVQEPSPAKERPDYGFIEPENRSREIETDIRNRESDEMDRSMDVTERPPRKQESVEGRPDQLAAEDEDVERMQSEEPEAERVPDAEIEEGDEESRSGRVNPEEEDEALKRRRKYNRPDDRTNAPE